MTSTSCVLITVLRNAKGGLLYVSWHYGCGGAAEGHSATTIEASAKKYAAMKKMEKKFVLT